MKFWALLIVGAVSPFLFVSMLPSAVAFVLLLLTATVALKPGIKPDLKLLCLAPVFFLTTTLFINNRIEQRLPLSENKSIHTLSGIIGSLPEANGDLTRFLFLPDDVAGIIPQHHRAGCRVRVRPPAPFPVWLEACDDS